MSGQYRIELRDSEHWLWGIWRSPFADPIFEDSDLVSLNRDDFGTTRDLLVTNFQTRMIGSMLLMIARFGLWMHLVYTGDVLKHIANEDYWMLYGFGSAIVGMIAVLTYVICVVIHKTTRHISDIVRINKVLVAGFYLSNVANRCGIYLMSLFPQDTIGFYVIAHMPSCGRKRENTSMMMSHHSTHFGMRSHMPQPRNHLCIASLNRVPAFQTGSVSVLELARAFCAQNNWHAILLFVLLIVPNMIMTYVFGQEVKDILSAENIASAFSVRYGHLWAKFPNIIPSVVLWLSGLVCKGYHSCGIPSSGGIAMARQVGTPSSGGIAMAR